MILVFNIYFQNHSDSHSDGIKKRSSGSHKDPLVSSVVSHITVFCVAVKFTDYFYGTEELWLHWCVLKALLKLDNILKHDLLELI